MWGENEEMKREWGNGERFTLYISSFSLHFLILFSFPPSLSISYIKICLKMLNTALLSQMSQTNLTYAPWENNSGSNSLRESSASCEGLVEDCVSVESRTTNEVGNKVYERTPDSKQMKPSGSKREGKCGKETRLFTISGFCSHEKARGCTWIQTHYALCRNGGRICAIFQN